MAGRRRMRRLAAVPEPPGTPTVVSVEMEYGPLVDRSPGVTGYDEAHPDVLGLSAVLADRLEAYAVQWHRLSRQWIAEEPATAESDRAEAAARRELVTLAHAVQHEAGRDVEVLLDDRPLGDRRGPGRRR